MQTITFESRNLDPRQSCFGQPGVREPLVGNHCLKMYEMLQPLTLSSFGAGPSWCVEPL